MAIFDLCPSPPLRWGDFIVQNLMDCARYGIPAEILPMSQLGATRPVTLAGSLVQLNAEFLSGVVMSQLDNPGAPVIFERVRWVLGFVFQPQVLDAKCFSESLDFDLPDLGPL
jgi:trimethylamine:corrinoid methyltransferase-like protein